MTDALFPQFQVFSGSTLFPGPCLLADVGGTNARFAMTHDEGRPLSPTVTLPTGCHDDFADTVRAAIDMGDFEKPATLLLAAAGAVDGHHLTLSNAETLRGMLAVNGQHLRESLSLEQGVLLNDFEALSLALPWFSDHDTLSIGGGSAVAGAPQIVIGAGTGLGVSALLSRDGVYVPLASEGGHIALAPESADDFRLWPLLGKGRLSGDDVLSGRGLSKLYRAMARLEGVDPLDHAPAAIASRGMDGQEPLASQCIDMFLGLLGRFAGDMAITFGARGGVFIAGGIAPRFAKRMISSPFRACFEAKQWHRPTMETIPVRLITVPDPALRGLSALAKDPQLFGLNYASRCWA